MAFQSPRATNILQAINVAEFEKIQTTTSNRFFGMSPASASAHGTIDAVNGTYGVFSGSFTTNAFEKHYVSKGSSSLAIAETFGLIDVRLNPQLYRKYKLNYALSTGSSYNAAVEYSNRF